MFVRSSLLFILLRSILSIDTFTAQLDCLRINVAFCCASRIKTACPGLCANVDCSPSFYRGMFSTDEDVQEGTVSIDESIHRKEEISANLEITTMPNPFPTLLPERKVTETTETQTIETTRTTAIEEATTESPSTTVASHLGEFGSDISSSLVETSTLATELPSVETSSQITELPITMESRATRVPRIRVTPDPRIIPPPDELAFISDIDENELIEDGSENQPTGATSDFLHHHRSQLPEIVAREMINGAPPGLSTTPTPTSPFLFTLPTFPPIFSFPTLPPFSTPSPMNWVNPFTEFPPVPAASPAADIVFTSTIPSEVATKSTTQIVEETTTKPNEESKGRSFSYALEPLVEKLLSSLPSPLSAPGKARRKQKKTGQTSHPQIQLKYNNLEGMIGSVETSTGLPIRTTIPPEGSFSFKLTRRQPPSANSIEEPVCGIGPKFRPCVPLEEASTRLLQCLQSKQLPSGCQKLARYDVTQKEVRGALDRGECGLLHIAPFLECASQKINNIECCRAKGVHTKGGEQCLAFCSPGPVTPGLQHLGCSNAMQEMLQCHHAGLKP